MWLYEPRTESKFESKLIDVIEKSVQEKLTEEFLEYDESTIHLLEAYVTAGRRELEKLSKREHWLYVRILLEETDVLDFIGKMIVPFIHSNDEIQSWWFLQKADHRGVHIRLRFKCEPTKEEHIFQMLKDTLHQDKRTLELQNIVYEPEVALFGGETGIMLAHDYFRADSEFITQWYHLRRDKDGLKTIQALSIYFIRTLMSATHMDAFEKWDCWTKVYSHRNHIPDESLYIESCQQWLKKVLRIEENHLTQLYQSEEDLQCLQLYQSFLTEFGQTLYDAYHAGELDRGVREFIAGIIIFHWNRLGLSYYHQALLSRSLMLRLDPLKSNQSSS